MEKIEFFSATTLHVELNHAKSLYVGTDQVKIQGFDLFDYNYLSPF